MAVSETISWTWVRRSYHRKCKLARQLLLFQLDYTEPEWLSRHRAPLLHSQG